MRRAFVDGDKVRVALGSEDDPRLVGRGTNPVAMRAQPPRALRYALFCVVDPRGNFVTRVQLAQERKPLLALGLDSTSNPTFYSSLHIELLPLRRVRTNSLRMGRCILGAPLLGHGAFRRAIQCCAYVRIETPPRVPLEHDPLGGVGTSRPG